MLLEENVIQTISSGNEATISLPNNASVKLPGDYIDENKNAYTGNVQVIMHHLNPSNEDMNMQMPGMLYAADENNEEQLLVTYGMLAIELRGDEGQDLNLAEGATAEIKVPLSSELMKNAPNSIPLSYFDENTGYWKEEGQATLRGNSYVAQVSHFTFWNCAQNFPAVSLCITLLDNNGNPIANQLFSLTHSNSSYIYPNSSGQTDVNGEVCGLIPANENLVINVADFNTCGANSLYTSNLGPYNNNATEIITLTNNSLITTQKINGSLNNCNGNPISNGFVKLTYRNKTYYNLVNNGSYQVNVISCTGNNAFSIEGFDNTSVQTTGEINYTFTPPTTNLGTLSTCNNSEFIQYDIDNGAESFIALTDIDATFDLSPQVYNGPIVSIYAYAYQTEFYLLGVLNSSQYTGTYDDYDWNTPGDTGFSFTQEWSHKVDLSSTNITFNLSKLGNVGDYIDINFSGNYNDPQGNPHTISGVIHVLRDQ